MDFASLLQTEITARRQVISAAKDTAADNEAAAEETKAVRRIDLDRVDLEKRKAEEAYGRIKRPKTGAEETAARESSTPSEEASTFDAVPDKTSETRISGDDATASSSSMFLLATDEITRRLRALSQPIRLFAESDRQRQLRLRALELVNDTRRDVEGTGAQRNEFRRMMEELDRGLVEEAAMRHQSGATESAAGKAVEAPAAISSDSAVAVVCDRDKTLAQFQLPIKQSLLRTDPDKLYGLIYVYLKTLLHEWEQELDTRDEDAKRLQTGRIAAATHRQTAENLKPFFRMLRKRKVEPDVFARITEILERVQEREYVKANDAYLRLSIGNSPWPIGVTMVGIHERKGREKISSSHVAHVLNDETQRKWIQSVKRLMTFAQRRYPPSDLTKLVG